MSNSKVIYSSDIQRIEKIIRSKEELLIQEYINGYGVGFFAIYDNGTLKKFFMHKRIRENPSSAISRADFLFCIGHKISRTKLRKTFAQLHSTKIVEGKFKANISPFFKKHKLVAFCGIGRPEKFFSMLRRLDLEIIEDYSYPDHHFYSNKQLNKILGVAKDNNALVVTTEKDFVKLPSTFTKKIYSVDIELHLEKNEILLKDLKNLVS